MRRIKYTLSMSPEGPPIQPQPPADDKETTKKEGAQEEFEQEPFSKQFEDLAHQAHELLEQAPNDAVRSITTRIERVLNLVAETAQDFETPSKEIKMNRTIASTLIDRLYDTFSVGSAAGDIWRVPQWDQAEPLKDLINEIEDARYELAKMLEQKFKIEQISPFVEVDRFDASVHEDDLAGPLTTTDPTRDNLIVQVLRPGVRANGEVILKAIVRRALYDKKAAETKDDDVIEVAASEEATAKEGRATKELVDRQLSSLLQELKTQLETSGTSPGFRATLNTFQTHIIGAQEGLKALQAAGGKLTSRIAESGFMLGDQTPAIAPQLSAAEFRQAITILEKFFTASESQRQLLKEEFGIEQISAVAGMKFDPKLCKDNPVTRVSTKDPALDQAIYEVIRPGFTQNNEVVARAYVKQTLYFSPQAQEKRAAEANEYKTSTEGITDAAAELIKKIDVALRPAPKNPLLPEQYAEKEKSDQYRACLQNALAYIAMIQERIIGTLGNGEDPVKNTSLRNALTKYNEQPLFSPGRLSTEEEQQYLKTLEEMGVFKRNLREWLKKEHAIDLLLPAEGTKFDPKTQEDNEHHRLPARTKANGNDLYEIIRNGFTQNGKVVEKAYVKRFVLTETTPETANEADDSV